MLVHIDGARQGWQHFDLTPPETNLGVTAFDVYEDKTGVLHMAAAQERGRCIFSSLPHFVPKAPSAVS